MLLTSIIIHWVIFFLYFEVVAHLVILVQKECCLFVDHEALNDHEAFNDQGTSSDSLQTPYHGSRQNIVNRDGGCIVTLGNADGCDAVRLIPGSKGDEVKLL